MIKKIENPNEFDIYTKTDLYSVRIKALLSAYGTGYDFAVFYKQLNMNGEITAILSKLDGDFTISMNKADKSELAEFIGVIGYSSCLCDGLIDNFSRYDEGIIMVSDRKTEYSLPYTEIDEYPKLMDLFNFQDYDKADFEAWYVDISHRIRHNTAKAYSVNVNNEIVSSGIFSSIHNNDAILTSVNTAPEFRRMGYGSLLVSHMMCDISGRVFLMREKNKNEHFYSRLGFINTGKWRLYK